MRVLVTGAEGFVGRHLLRALPPGTQALTPGFDVTDPAATAAALEHARPDAVIHLAAIAAPMDARRDPARAWAVNLHGTLTLARAILDQAPRALLLFAGTADAYGASFRPGTPLDETAALAPQNTYGATKAAADLALGAMVADGLRLVRARPFNHTGPGQTDAYVVPAFAHQAARIAAGHQPPVMHVGALHPERDFLDVRDVVAAYAAILTTDLPPRHHPQPRLRPPPPHRRRAPSHPGPGPRNPRDPHRRHPPPPRRHPPRRRQPVPRPPPPRLDPHDLLGTNPRRRAAGLAGRWGREPGLTVGWPIGGRAEPLTVTKRSTTA